MKAAGNHMEVMDWRDGKAIEAECERRREAVDVDPSDGREVLDAVQWAVSVLQEMGAQERTIAEDSGKEEAGKGTSTDAVRKKDAEPNNPRESPTLGGDDDETEVLEGKKPEFVESESETLKKFSSVQEGDAESRNERKKRKSGVFVLEKSPSGKRARTSEKDMTINNKDVYECLEAAVKEADCGKAGATMAERVQAWLSWPQCLNLTKLIRHCLDKSLSQQPPRKDNVKQSGVWLHQWLVKTIMQNTPKEAQRTVLHQSVSGDWLVAHLTAVNPKIFVAVVLDDLVEDVVECRHRSLTTFSPYVQRVGILEYAALRGPEHIADALQSTFPIFSSTVVSTEEEGTSGSQNKSGVRLEATLSVWLVMATFGPQFVGALVHHLLPLLTVETIRSWTCLFAGKVRMEEVLLPLLQSALVGITPEEPGNIWVWLHAIISRRLSELATVGADLVLLLSRLIQPSKTDGVAKQLSSFATFILEVLYRELSKCLLSRVIGVGQPTSGEPLTALSKEEAQTGALQFADNLKNNMPKLWLEFLSTCSESTCPCCQSAPRDSSEPDMHTKLAQNGVGHSKAQMLANSLEIDQTHGVQINTKIDGTTFGKPTNRSYDCQGCESNKKMILLKGKGCEHLDPFVQICHLAILCCGKCTIAELLAEATVMMLSDGGVLERTSFKKLLVVMRVMQMVAGQGRGAQVLEMWAQILVKLLAKANTEQALQKTLAIRLLLDPSFWERHQRVRGPFNNPEQDDEESGLAWKLVWILLRKVLDFQWLQLVPLLHRKDAWDLQLVVLGVLQFLSPDTDSRPQTVVNRLKCVLGIFFQWLDEEVNHMDCLNLTDKRGDVVVGEKWQRVRAMEQLKRVIVQQAALAFSTFTLMVSSLLDYSFEHCARKAGALSSSSRGLRLQSSTAADNYSGHGGTDMRTWSDYPMTRRGLGVGSRGSLSISTLVAGRLDRYGNFTLLSAPTLSEKNRSSPANGLLLSEENRKNRSGGLSSLDVYERERLGPTHRNSNPVRPLAYSSRDGNRMDKGQESAETTMMELTDVLRRAVGSAVSMAANNPGAWSPANVLVMLIIDRLETPHETPMSIEQYEEVLPKLVSSPRHVFLMDCFGHNQLLLELVLACVMKVMGLIITTDGHKMLELVVKHGEIHEVLRCVEFIRVLLADSISRWHTAYRTRRSPALPSLKVSEAEKLDRLQVGRLIQLVADTGWLPQPLALTTEIVEVIDGADIADLLLLVWRCMHHAMAFGSKSWGGVSDNPPLPSGAVGAVGDPQLQGADDDSSKEGSSYTEWEGHLFAILRQNVAQIGAHFAQVYPIRRAF